MLGQNLATTSAFIWAIANGDGINKAIGYWMGGGALSLAWFLITKDNEEAGIPAEKLAVWIVFCSAVAATLLF